MSDASVLPERREAVLRLTLNRPKVHNAFDEHLIAALTAELEKAASDASLRAVVLAGAGRSFSAGADLDWMRRMATYDEAQNLEDARALERLLRTLDRLPVPTVALVNGAAIGGGVGLVACCDVAIGAESAVFALSEVRLGLVPATIGPYVVRAIGERACRRLFLTAERFGAEEAARLGLLHETAPAGELEARGEAVLAEMLRGGPEALREAKALLRTIREQDGATLGEGTARLIARRRASAEGREGVGAFLEKRAAGWVRS
ncbi:enoyl-CoA hydratase-related protein [Geminicoccaceae bacterium 1502E]|nr:enoyl-CoA hydratase-related protein [Geminicoccaceae bacterium 1502E]